MKIKACRFRAKTGEPERGAGSRTAIPAIRRASCRARNHETCRVWPGAARWFVLLMNASERCFLIHTRQRRGLFFAETAPDLADAPHAGTVMDVENTDLERRVLAHEQILQVLIAHMAEAEPRFLDRLQQIFTKHHTLGDNEQDYTDTAAYAEQFIHQVVRLRDRERRG
jgi:hypothetical protein